MREAKCAICGKAFETNSSVKMYCSKDCYRESQRQSKQRHDERKKRKAAKNDNDRAIYEIAMLAKEKGLSYGMYIAQYEYGS